MSTNRSDAPPSPSDRRDTDPDNAPATPRDTSITVTLPSDAPPKRSSRRPRSATDTGEDTLLSAPAPAEGLDPELQERLRGNERRIDDLESRVRYLENLGRAAPAPGRATHEWLVWVVLLLVLAVSWMLFHR